MTENKNDPVVSIVVPIYNSENYLDQCIESIVNQTYKRIEILLIDDGSTDSSYSICEKWRENDGRIKLFRKNNEGVSVARNFGTSHSSGDYILYIDSDDWISPRLVETAVGYAIKKSVDIVLYRFVSVKKDGSIKHQSALPFEKKLTPVECFELLLNGKIASNHTWRYLFSKEIAIAVDFPKDRVYEDMFTIYKRILRAESIYCINDELYYYRERLNSLSHSFSVASMNDQIDGICERYSYAVEHYPELKQVAIHDKERRLVNVFNRLLKQKASERTTQPYKLLKRRICMEIKDLPIDSNLDKNTKNKVIVLQNHPNLAELYCKLIIDNRILRSVGRIIRK